MKVVKYNIGHCLHCPACRSNDYGIKCLRIISSCGQHRTKSLKLLEKNPFPEWCPLEDAEATKAAPD